MSELEMLGVGGVLGASVVAFGWLAVQITQDYVDRQVREAERDMKSWVRERDRQ